MQVNDSVEQLKGVGDVLTKKLAKLDIHTIEDLLLYYPRRYNDFSEIQTISKLRPGPVTIKASLKQATGRYVRRGMHITEAVVSDKTSSVRLVWFNQPYRAKALKEGKEYFVSGPLELKSQKFAIMNPSMELVSDFPINTARIVPIYREHKNIKSTEIRRCIREAFDAIPQLETSLPTDVEKRYKLLSRIDALEQIHFPANKEKLEQAKRRIGFEEVFELILANLLLKSDVEQSAALPIEFKEDVAKKIVKSLPFDLTDAQRKSAWEIYQDLEKAHPMNRLLEGDVGAGKTAVATMAAIMCIDAGLQVALMAPTELLARQHAETLVSLLKPMKLENKVCLLVGSMKNDQKKQAQKSIDNGQAQFIVGTHALIQEKVNIKRLALAIVDEQHRFGVVQRKRLLEKTGHMPHLLSMTATPIPRSLALTLYGEMDISILKSKPKNRKPIITELVRPATAATVQKKIQQELERGNQVFVVCPLIEQSEMLDAVSVEKAYEKYVKVFSKHKVAMLHGKQKTELKQETMQKFASGKIDVLVATTVIEVGVDVPNANIMIVESPERFGLAQIHQLRGRVGRGDEQGYCYLMLQDNKPPSRRLQAIAKSNDGFRLAELDLEIRGPGAIYGTSQHGVLDLRMADITDVALIKQAREAADEYVQQPEKVVKYPQLQKRIKQLQKITHLN